MRKVIKGKRQNIACYTNTTMTNKIKRLAKESKMSVSEYIYGILQNAIDLSLIVKTEIKTKVITKKSKT